MQLNNDVRNAINDAIDVQVGTTGEVRFFTAALATVLANINLNNPAFNASGTGTAGIMAINTATTLEDTSPANGGVCTRMAFYSGTGVTDSAWELLCSVAATGADVDMSNTTIAVSDTVQLTSFSITCPVGTLP